MPDDTSALKFSERLNTGIELGESHFREFKSALDRMPPTTKARDAKLICRDIAETLVAFANADGGEIYVGVENDGSVTGIPHSEAAIDLMLDSPKTHVHQSTPLPDPTIGKIQFQQKVVLYFQTAKSTQRVHLTSDGRCLQRFDRENRPVPAEEIQYGRQEQKSREYDREFVARATLQDLEVDLIDKISQQIAGGQSAEKFLQYMDIAEYGSDGLRLRRAALLLFARDVSKWHPRSEIRIVRVSGQSLGVGHDYDINPRDDNTVRGNALHVVDTAWDMLRPYLARTKLVESTMFTERLVYPEEACREALVNAVAHRDYSIEGKGIELFIYDDRLEVRSPGGLLSSISIDDLRTGKRTHQSRNVYMARVLREVGYMREMGEGMLRIFATMRDSDLVPPELEADPTNFSVVLHHRSVFSPKDQEWLKAYGEYNLSRDEQRTILLGRDGHLLSTNEIVKALGIVDMDDFRQLVERVRRKGILYTAISRGRPLGKAKTPGSKREVGRFSIRPPDQTEQYRQELMTILRNLGDRSSLGPHLGNIKAQLSRLSPYRENVAECLKLLGFVDERLRPLPFLATLWQQPGVTRPPSPTDAAVQPSPLKVKGVVVKLKSAEGYGFISTTRTGDYFFHISDLLDRSEWGSLRIRSRVLFEPEDRGVPRKKNTARNVKLLP